MSVTTPTTTAQRAWQFAAGAYVAFLVFALLWPTAQVQSDGVGGIAELGARLHLPQGLVSRSEEIGNALIFVPLPLIGAHVWQRSSILEWMGVGFVVSLAVEVSQRLLLSGRSGSAIDVVANTIGALAGAVLVWLTGRVRHRSADYTPAGPDDAAGGRRV